MTGSAWTAGSACAHGARWAAISGEQAEAADEAAKPRLTCEAHHRIPVKKACARNSGGCCSRVASSRSSSWPTIAMAAADEDVGKSAGCRQAGR